jgi:hypothetical protein
MIDKTPVRTWTPNEGARSVSRLFLTTFLASCFWFWWLLSLVFRRFLGIEDPVTNWGLGASLLAAGCFAIGFLVRQPRPRPSAFAASTLDRCEDLSYKLTLLLFVPAMALALWFAAASIGKAYGEQTVGFADQIVYYFHLFFGFMFLGVATSGKGARRRVWLAIIALVLPRLIVSLHFGRFFLAQGVVPILFLAVARGFVRLSSKRLLQVAILGLFILFVPSITRGDPIFGNDDQAPANQSLPQIAQWLSAGSSLEMTEEYRDLDLRGRCPPLLVSLTAKLVPYTLLHLCTIRLRDSDYAANLDMILTADMTEQSIDLTGEEDIGGAGASFLLELYLTGGIAAVVLGSLAFGFLCRLMTASLAARSLFSGIWAECLMRAAFAPRGTLGYVFEKVPWLVLATVLVTLLCGQPDRSRGQASCALSRA